MDDLERYGDYNETEEDIPRGKNPVVLILKLLIALVCISVVGFLVFRVAIFNYYPDNIENVYFNETLNEYCNANGGEVVALTQDLRYPYDDADKGRFFCDNLIVIKDAGQLQISLRFNVSVKETIQRELGVEIDPDDEGTFVFSLERDPVANTGEAKSEPIGSISAKISDSLLMYRYYKLVFDGIDFSDGTDEQVEWLRLKIEINGVEMKTPYYVLIYENHKDNSGFKDYPISKRENGE